MAAKASTGRSAPEVRPGVSVYDRVGAGGTERGENREIKKRVAVSPPATIPHRSETELEARKIVGDPVLLGEVLILACWTEREAVLVALDETNRRLGMYLTRPVAEWEMRRSCASK
jgi:hypothetical protein